MKKKKNIIIMVIHLQVLLLQIPSFEQQEPSGHFLFLFFGPHLIGVCSHSHLGSFVVEMMPSSFANMADVVRRSKRNVKRRKKYCDLLIISTVSEYEDLF